MESPLRIKLYPKITRYIYTAQLTITGKGDTLPVQLQGLGIGPECAIIPDFLDLGDLHLFSVYQYEVELQNRGELEVLPGLALAMKRKYSLDIVDVVYKKRL